VYRGMTESQNKKRSVSEASYSLKEGYWYMDLGSGTSPFMIKAGGILLQFPLTPLFSFCVQQHLPFSTNMAQVLCPSCDKAITQKGLAAHLQKTQNVCCRTVCHTLHAPGAIHGTASSLVSIPAVPYLFSPEDDLEFGANQWPWAEMDFSMRTQQGKLTATHVSGWTMVLIICTFQDRPMILFLVMDCMPCLMQWTLIWWRSIRM